MRRPRDAGRALGAPWRAFLFDHTGAAILIRAPCRELGRDALRWYARGGRRFIARYVEDGRVTAPLDAGRDEEIAAAHAGMMRAGGPPPA